MKLPDKTYLHGEGSASVIILAKGDGTIHVGNYCRVSNLSFTGEEKFKARHEDALNKAIVSLGASTGAEVDHIRIVDYSNTGVVTDHAADFRITDCHFEKINSAIQIQNSKRGLVSGNRVIDAAVHGIQFWGNWKFESKNCEDLIFSNNYVKNGGGGAIWGTGAVRVIMANNIIDGAEDVGLDLEWCDDSVIMGNTVRNCENGGISLFYSCRRITISGNTVINDRPIKPSEFPASDPRSKFFVRSGIWLTYPNKSTFKNDNGHREVTIVGNTIHCAEGERRAIWIGSESDEINIANNTLVGGEVKYGGKHNVHPLDLITVKDNAWIHNGVVPKK